MLSSSPARSHPPSISSAKRPPPQAKDGVFAAVSRHTDEAAEGLKKSFGELHAESLAASVMGGEVDVSESGVSATVVVYDGPNHRLSIANVGDSKAVLGTGESAERRAHRTSISRALARSLDTSGISKCMCVSAFTATRREDFYGSHRCTCLHTCWQIYVCLLAPQGCPGQERHSSLLTTTLL